MNKTEIFAHRGQGHGSTNGLDPTGGAYVGYAENSIPALLTAALQGFHLEWDVLASGDRPDPAAIVAHGDANDEGILDNEDLALVAGDTPLRDLQRFGLVAHSPGQTHLPPLLDWVLDALVGKDVRLNIELKGAGSAFAVTRCLQRRGTAGAGWDPRIIFSSFKPNELEAARKAFPEADLALLLWSGAPLVTGARMEQFIARNRVTALHVDIPLAHEGMLEWAATLGCAVRVYTVNDPIMAIGLVHRGVTGLFTDFPQVIASALQ
ncbi:MAG TPA: glycerophosphodiester phosphodiesterase family protein [Candidatus Paceibacterota bacterium]|nr:glycerophosphodiester phosphodiesterase family protein [Candidatus Paceibacterota bacterium]